MKTGYFAWLFIPLCLLAVLTFFINPLMDADLPWHLSSGNYIFDNRFIPDQDPLSYAEDSKDLTFFGKFVLSQYWLAQVCMYTIYDRFHEQGLVIVRSILLASITFMVFGTNRKNGILFTSLISFFYTAYMLIDYDNMRPALFTYLFTAVLLFLITRYQILKRNLYLYLIPLIFLPWANLHGGYIFGILILTIYLVTTILQTKLTTVFFPENNLLPPKPTIIAWGLSMAAASVNPNGLMAIPYAMQTHSADIARIIGEYTTPFDPQISGMPFIIKFWVTIPLVIVTLLATAVKRQFAPTLVILCTVMMSLKATRYIPLLVVVTSFYAHYLPWPTFSSGKKSLHLLLIIIPVSFLYFLLPSKLGRSYSFRDTSLFPVSAVDFLQKHHISGNIFSSYNKSAFIAFKLYPEAKIYFDARYMSSERVKAGTRLEGVYQPDEYLQILLTNLVLYGYSRFDRQIQDLEPFDNEWFLTLNNNNTEIVVHEMLNPFSGEIYPLIFRLLIDAAWELIYIDGNVSIFRNSDRETVPSDHLSKPKELLYKQLIWEAEKGIRYGSSIPKESQSNYLAQMALGLLLAGNPDSKASFFIEQSLILNPENKYALLYSEILDKLESLNTNLP